MTQWHCVPRYSKRYLQRTNIPSVYAGEVFAVSVGTQKDTYRCCAASLRGLEQAVAISFALYVILSDSEGSMG